MTFRGARGSEEALEDLPSRMKRLAYDIQKLDQALAGFHGFFDPTSATGSASTELLSMGLSAFESNLKVRALTLTAEIASMTDLYSNGPHYSRLTSAAVRNIFF